MLQKYSQPLFINSFTVWPIQIYHALDTIDINYSVFQRNPKTGMWEQIIWCGIVSHDKNSVFIEEPFKEIKEAMELLMVVVG